MSGLLDGTAVQPTAISWKAGSCVLWWQVRLCAPVVRITVDTLADELAAVLTHTPRRRALGQAGRAYVEREHEAHVIARRLVQLYRDIGAQ